MVFTIQDEGYGTARWVVNKSVIDSIGLTVGTSVEGSEERFDLPNLAFTHKVTLAAGIEHEIAPDAI